MASSPLSPSNDGVQLGRSDAGEPAPAAELAVLESLAAKFPQLLSRKGKAMLAAARDGDFSGWVASGSADEVAALHTPSPAAPQARDSPQARAAPPPPPAPARDLLAEEAIFRKLEELLARPALPLPPAPPPPLGDARPVDAAMPVAALARRHRWCVGAPLIFLRRSSR